MKNKYHGETNSPKTAALLSCVLLMVYHPKYSLIGTKKTATGIEEGNAEKFEEAKKQFLNNAFLGCWLNMKRKEEIGYINKGVVGCGRQRRKHF